MAIQYNVNRLRNRVDVQAVSDKHRPDGYPAAELSVQRSVERPNFQTDYYGYGPSDQFYDHNDEYDEPTELFTHVPPSIMSAYSDKSLRHTLPTMIGIAMNDMKAGKDVPMAGMSLTKYSSALSRNAVDRGLAIPHYLNPHMESDDDEWDDDIGEMVPAQPKASEIPSRTVPTVRPYYMEPVSDAEVAAGRQWVRSKIRGSEPPKPKKRIVRGDSQFEQLNLGI